MIKSIFEFLLTIVGIFCVLMFLLAGFYGLVRSVTEEDFKAIQKDVDQLKTQVSEQRKTIDSLTNTGRWITTPSQDPKTSH